MPAPRSKPKIAIATCRELPHLFEDDHPLIAALAAAGVTAEPAVWNDDVAWSDYAAVVLRSTWDYHLHVEVFRAWLDRLDRTRVPCWNPTSLVRWNLDKHYLNELAAKGVPTVPTLWIERDQADTVERILATGWTDVVVKPAVSAGAWKTLRLAHDEVRAHAPFLTDALGSGALMVQPFMPEIVDEGEYSLLFFDGEFSHAVLKRPKSGDFRVQWVHGGSQVPIIPSETVIAQARRALAAAPSIGLYGRVDGVLRDGRLILMELELIEPYLYLSEGPEGVGRFVRALLSHL